MSPLGYIIAGVLLLATGAGLWHLLLCWRDRTLKRVRTLESEAGLARAHNEAEIIIRDARLAAAEEARKLREEVEQSFAARRAERIELERRLAEREALINSQLEHVLEAEKTLNEQKAAFRQRVQAVDSQERAAAEQTRQAQEQLGRLAGMSEAEARAEFLKRYEHEAQRDAGNLARRIIEEAKARAEEKS